jgi:hypothetical protein
MSPPNKKGRGLPADAPIQKLLTALYQKTGHEAKKNGKGYTTLCPAHDDKNPSLSILVRSDGSVWPTCFCGCTVEAILNEIGLAKTDLFPSTKPRKPRGENKNRRQAEQSKPVGNAAPSKARKGGKVYSTFEEAKASLDSFMTQREEATFAQTWWYHDEASESVAAAIRYNLPTPEGEKQKKTFRPISKHADGWRWGDPSGKWPLYNLQAIKESKTVCVVEGEKAASAASLAGCESILPPFTTSAHGAKSAAKTDWTPLAGKEVILFPDNDSSGEDYIRDVSCELSQLQPRPTVKLDRLPDLPVGGDVADHFEWYRDNIPQAVAALKKSISSAQRVVEPRTEPSNPKKHAARAFSPAGGNVHFEEEDLEPPPYVPFPTDILPHAVAIFINQTAIALGCDPSYVALPLLAALASAVGNSRGIQLKPGWCEPLILWTIVVGPSGTLKSPAWEKAVNFLQRRQDEAFAEYKDKLKQFKQDYCAYEVDLGVWKRSGKKNVAPQPMPPDEPTPQRLVCSDATVEAVAVLLEDNPRGLLLARDELSGWISSFDAYKSTRGADAPHWLNMHRAGAMTIDRKTGRRIIHVPRAAVSIAGSVQPEILKLTIVGKDGDEGGESIKEHLANGLTARLLMAYAPPVPKRWTDATVPASTTERLETIFEHLFALEGEVGVTESIEPLRIPLSSSAKQEFIKFFNVNNEEQINLPTHLGAAWSKLEGYAARFALLFHLIRCVPGEPNPPQNLSEIDLESMVSGIELARWFEEEAVRIYAIIGACYSDSERAEERRTRRVLDWIAKRGGRVTARELQQGKREFQTADDADKCLHALVAMGHGTWQPSPRGAAGRPTRHFELTVHTSIVNESSVKTGKITDSVDAEATNSGVGECSRTAQAGDGWGEL